MTVYTNECCDCATGAYPCLGNSCPNRNVPHEICDCCQQEEKLYRHDGEILCMDCIFSAASEHGKCDICGECGALIAVNGEMLCIECASEELEEYDGEF